MTALTDLPPEILSNVIHYVSTAGEKYLPEHYIDRTALSRLSLTCKSLRHLVQPFLFQYLRACDYNIIPLLRALSERPDLAQMAKELGIRLHFGAQGASPNEICFFNEMLAKYFGTKIQEPPLLKFGGDGDEELGDADGGDEEDEDDEEAPETNDDVKELTEVDDIEEEAQEINHDDQEPAETNDDDDESDNDYESPTESDDDDEEPAEIDALASLIICLVNNITSLTISKHYETFPAFHPASLPHLNKLTVSLNDSYGGMDLSAIQPILATAPALRTLHRSLVGHIPRNIAHPNITTINLENSNISRSMLRAVVKGFPKLESFSYN